MKRDGAKLLESIESSPIENKKNLITQKLSYNFTLYFMTMHILIFSKTYLNRLFNEEF